MSVEIRPAGPGDVDQAARLLHAKMDPSIPLDRWHRIMAYDWGTRKPDWGIVAVDGDRVVGFHGCIYSERTIAGRAELFGNFTSMYLLKAYRSKELGIGMMKAHAARADTTYSVYDASPRIHHLLEGIGFVKLDQARLIWRRRGPPSLRVLTDPAEIRPLLATDQQRLLDDHGDLAAHPHLALTDDGPCLLFFTVQDRDHGLDHEVLHAGDPAVLAGHAQAIADAILPDAPARLAVDSRFLTGHATSGRREVLPTQRYVKTTRVAPADVDHLYSETLLLELKTG